MSSLCFKIGAPLLLLFNFIRIHSVEILQCHGDSSYTSSTYKDCQYKTIDCAEEDGCHLICDGQYSCIDVEIYGNNANLLNVTCIGDYACTGMYIEGWTQETVVSISGVKCFEGGYISCPLNKSCTVFCSGLSGCKWSGIDGWFASELSLNVGTDGGSFMMYESDVYCPDDFVGICTVTCSKSYGCYKMRLYAATSTELNLYVIADAGSVMNQARLYLPKNGVYGNTNNSKIYIYGNNNVWTSTYIYTEEGINDITVICDSICDPGSAELYCKGSYSLHCNLISVNNTWRCSDVSHACQTYFLPTTSPTQNPTLPTLYPTYPSSAPTTSPSTSPIITPFTNPNILFVRYNGCDRGDCSSVNGTLDFDIICKYNSDAFCCIDYEIGTNPTNLDNDCNIRTITGKRFNANVTRYEVNSETSYDAVESTENAQSVCIRLNNTICYRPMISNTFLNTTHFVAFGQASNVLNNECKSLTSNTGCGTYSDCMVDYSDIDDWLYGNVTDYKMFYFIYGNGCDYYSRAILDFNCENPDRPSTCRSLNYSWQCFNGQIDECNGKYDGQHGLFNLGDGEFDLFDSIIGKQKQLAFKGVSKEKTGLNHKNQMNLIAVECDWQCYFKITQLTYYPSNNASFQIYDGGNALFQNVIFDGQNKTVAFYIDGDTTNVTFNHCQFTNLRQLKNLFIIANAATIYFNNVIFKENVFFDDMIIIQNGNMIFNNVFVSNNKGVGDNVILINSLHNNNVINIQYSTFWGNEYIWCIISQMANNGQMFIQQNIFENNINLNHLIQIRNVQSITTILNNQISESNNCLQEYCIELLDCNVRIDQHSSMIHTGSPTSSPTASPSSLFPTISPTDIPSNMPTTLAPAPTAVMNVSYTLCDSFSHYTGWVQWSGYCYDVVIAPLATQKSSFTVDIQQGDSTATYSKITFIVIGNNECIEPTINFEFEEIDFSSKIHEYISVFAHNLDDNHDTLIKKCTANEDANCGHWINCLNQTKINTFSIIIYKSSYVNDRCHDFHSNSINAKLTLECQSNYSNSIAPTPTPTTPQIVKCFDYIEGATTGPADIQHYTLIIHNPWELITIDACPNSFNNLYSFNTLHIRLYDVNWNVFEEVGLDDDCRFTKITISIGTDFVPGIYYIAMGSDTTDFGSYSFDILCEPVLTAQLRCETKVKTTTTGFPQHTLKLTAPLTTQISIDVCETGFYSYNIYELSLEKKSDSTLIGLIDTTGGDCNLTVVGEFLPQEYMIKLNTEYDCCLYWYYTLNIACTELSATQSPSSNPTIYPTDVTSIPTINPTREPTITRNPTMEPTINPTTDPTINPTLPTLYPTLPPTGSTNSPSTSPTTPSSPPTQQTIDPTINPTLGPTLYPTSNPTATTLDPTLDPTFVPTDDPTFVPTIVSLSPSSTPTAIPTIPTSSPTFLPINCGDIDITGTTATVNEFVFYTLILNHDVTKITIDTCGSLLDTYVRVYDINMDVINECDDCGLCGYQAQLTVRNLNAGLYTVAIGGPDGYGPYLFDVICNFVPTPSPTNPTDSPSILTYSPTIIPSISHSITTTGNPTEITFNPTPNPTYNWKMIRYGHSENNSNFTTLYLINTDPKSLIENIEISHFGPENGSVIYEPCDPFDPHDFSDLQYIFDELTDNINVNKIVFDDVRVREQLTCNYNDTRKEYCYMECSGSCAGSIFTSNATNITAIKCSGLLSCLESTINIEATHTATILCENESSCEETNILSKNVDNFVLECVSENACLELVINITNAIHAEIKCYWPNSCNNIQVHSNRNDIQLTIFNPNELISIYVPSDYQLNNILCDPLDAYLSLHGQTFESINRSLTQSALDLYGGTMPCSNIHFHFTEVDRVSCDIRTTFTQQYLDVLQYLYNYITCFEGIALIDIIGFDCFGSLSPTTDPTTDPTNDPTTSPTRAPSNAPTLSPSASPTNVPSSAPTNTPSITPSSSPTNIPSLAPSLFPTIAPSIAPSQAPSRLPTIHNQYDSFIWIKYIMTNYNDDELEEIMQQIKTIFDSITLLIEQAYLEDTETILEYYDFWVVIQKVNEIKPQQITDKNNKQIEVEWKDLNKIVMDSMFYCDETFCNHLLNKYDVNTFELNVQRKIRNYFDDMTQTNAIAHFESEIMFYIEDEDTLNVQPLYPFVPNPWFDPFIIAMATFVGFMCIVAILAMIHKKKYIKIPASIRVDDSLWYIPMILALQIWDFFSDINLAIQMLYMINNGGVFIFCAFGSTIFVVMPYVINLFMALQIKKFVSENEIAASYYQGYVGLFVAVTCFTGSAYTALQLTSSAVFGLNIFNSGLTLFELQKLSKLKVFGAVFIENIPQLLIQIVYSFALGDIKPNIVLSFTASSLSVISAIIGYFIQQQNGNDTRKIYRYKLQFRKVNGCLTGDETQLMLYNKGRTEALAQMIGGVFHTPFNNIQIAKQSISTNYGVMFYVIHCLNDTELIQEDDEEITIPPKIYVQNVYKQHNKELNRGFMQHFGLMQSLNQWNVTIAKSVQFSNSTAMITLNEQREHNEEPEFQRMTTKSYRRNEGNEIELVNSNEDTDTDIDQNEAEDSQNGSNDEEIP